MAFIFGQLPLIFRLRLLPLCFFIGFLLGNALLLGLVGLLLGDALPLGFGLLPRLFLHLLLPCVDLRAAALHLGRARPFRAHDGIALGFGHALGGLRAVSHAGVCAQLLVRHALRALHDLLRLPLVHLRLLERQPPLLLFFLFRRARILPRVGGGHFLRLIAARRALFAPFILFRLGHAQKTARPPRPEVIRLPADQPNQPIDRQPRRQNHDDNQDPVFAKKFQQGRMVGGKQRPDRVDQRAHPAHQQVKQRVCKCSHVSSVLWLRLQRDGDFRRA